MKTINPFHLILLGAFYMLSAKIYSQTIQPKTDATMETVKKTDTQEQIFIDKFFVPKNAKQEFDERMNINRNFISKLPGFIEDNAYVRTDEHGDFICVTVAVWKNEEAIKKAKEAVQAEYKKQGFDMQAMLKRLSIVIDRGVYKRVGEN